MGPLESRVRDLRRAVSAHRRLLAAGLVALAAALTLTALEPEPAPTVKVVAASHDLAGGVPVKAADLTTVALPRAAVPSGSLVSAGDAVGRVLAAPIRAGEPITDVRLVGPALVAAYGPGMVATPVRVADAAVLALIGPGDRVDVLATAPESDGGAPVTRVVAAHVPVVTVPEATSGYDEGGLLVVATTNAQAVALADAAFGARLSIIVIGE